MELAMFRHSSMPGMSSWRMRRSLHLITMLPDDPVVLRTHKHTHSDECFPTDESERRHEEAVKLRLLQASRLKRKAVLLHCRKRNCFSCLLQSGDCFLDKQRKEQFPLIFLHSEMFEQEGSESHLKVLSTPGSAISPLTGT